MKKMLAIAALAVATGLPASAEDRREMNFRLEPGGRFRLDTSYGSVTIRGKASPGVRVVVTSKREPLDELLVFNSREEPGSVEIVAKKRRQRLFSFGRERVHYEIEVPSATTTDIDTSGGSISAESLKAAATLDTSGGSISARDIEGNLDADTSGGSIRVSQVRGDIRLDTSGGSIDGDDLDGPVIASTSGGGVSLKRVTGDLRARSSGGSIEIDEAAGRVDADTSGGSIRARLARGNARGGTLETSGGGISVALDPAANLTIDAHGNSVRTDLPIRVAGEISKRRLAGDLGRGGETLRLSTSGGGVRISAID